MEIVFLVFLALFIQGLVFGFFCSYIAGEKNRGKAAWFWLGFFFSVLAIFALVAVPKIDKEKESADTTSLLTPATEAETPERTFDKERNIAYPAYQLFLTKRFSIEKNSTLDKFVIEEDVFDTLEDVLRDADSRYTRQLTAQVERMDRQARDQEHKNSLEKSVNDAIAARLLLAKIQSEELYAKLEPIRQANRKKAVILSTVSLAGIVIGIAFWAGDYFSELKIAERMAAVQMAEQAEQMRRHVGGD